ncbi:hypothetical protein CBR_g37451 [Chara braunii]|uniref:SCP2 domain-containing protein n=1 Tax=Chara braunii TaxID=69332 RepID=A0A388LN06_CHABU|nr:hypothetical protein CBR_g37451 [Chara braunii]|eukprot:GBG83649.1 hypothetical protein CBR_g37451 [Chara braunii]
MHSRCARCEGGEVSGHAPEVKADATFSFADADFVAVATGKMNPQMAFLSIAIPIVEKLETAEKAQSRKRTSVKDMIVDGGLEVSGTVPGLVSLFFCRLLLDLANGSGLRVAKSRKRSRCSRLTEVFRLFEDDKDVEMSQE